LGAAVTLWATFVPCFLWVLAGAPYVEWLKSVPRLRSALAAITAAVVGVIFNLSLWFALHVFFRSRYEVVTGPLQFDVPSIASLDPAAVALAALAAVLLFIVRAGIVTTLGISALASLILGLLP
jgi:chromate transporter